MKKFLSMALALVMTLSLCAVFTAPKASAGFADADELSSQYAVQAADVIQKIEVMDGYSDGTFRPTAGLTRQAAAKIICNMILGPTTAKALPTNARPFPDVVPSATGEDNQFAGYISYCSQQGIISGYADGTFRPNDPLSGYAYLKMLLGALGYDAMHEGFVGDNWKVNVAKIALGIGLNKGIEEDLDGTTQVTREAAAIYAFNTIQGDMVEYESKNTLEVNGVSISMGGGNAVPQTWNTSSTSADNINAATSDGRNARPIVQFAERYFDKLVRRPNEWDTYTQDDFGRPSIKWFWKGIEIGTYSRDADATFVGNVKVNEIYEALGMTSGDNGAYLFINSNVPNNSQLKVERANDKDLDHANNLNMDRDEYLDRAKTQLNPAFGDNTDVWTDETGVVHRLTHRVDRIGEGTLIECFRNEANNHVDVCVISVYGGKVSAVKAATSKKDAYVTIDYASDDDAKHRPDTINIVASGNNEYETEDFEENDVVAYTYSDSARSIKSMYLTTAESGALTSRIAEKSIRLDDVPYTYGKEYTFNDMQEKDLSGKSSYIVYLDANDFVVWVEEDEFAADQYVLIERITIENKNGTRVSSNLSGTDLTSVQAVVRTSSGTRRTVSLDDSKNYRDSDFETSTTVNAILPAFRAGRIVRLTSGNNGYRLHSVDNKYLTTVPGFALKNKKMYTGSFANEILVGGSLLLADSETRFIVEDTVSDTYKPYVGIKNAPNIQVTDNGAYVAGSTAYVYRRNNLAKMIFVTSATRVSSASNDIVFLAAKSTSNLVESDDGNYYDVTAVDKGEIKTVRIKEGTWFNTNWTNVNNDTVTFSLDPDANHNGWFYKDTWKEWNSVILNDVTYDSNDLIIQGRYKTSDMAPTAHFVQGIRRVNAEELRLNTASTDSYLRDAAGGIRVYFADGDEIEEINYEDIVNDTMDFVYYVEDDGEITYLFIVNYDSDGSPIPRANAGGGGGGGAVVTYNFNIADNVPDGYAIAVTGGLTEGAAGDVITFRVNREGVADALTSDDIQVAIAYTDVDGEARDFTLPAEAEANALWTMTIPDDVGEDSELIFIVEEIVGE